MMTVSPASPPISTFQDILNVLEHEPQLLQSMRGYILDQELRELPNSVADLVSAVNGLTAVTRSNTERIDRLEAAVAQLVEVTRSNTERIDRLEAAVERLEATVAQLVEVTRSNTERIDRLEAAVTQLAADQAELKATVAQLAEVTRSNTERIDRLEAAVERLEATVAQLAEVTRSSTERIDLQLLDSRANAIHLQRISGLVADIAGTQYERLVARIVHRRLRRALPIPDAAVIHTDWNPGPVIEEVIGSDNLSDAEVDDVSVIDFIAAGRDTAGNPAYAAGEISITAQPIDVVKAARRAATVAKALDCTVHPVVVGQGILDETEAAAQERGVTVITIAPPPD